MRLPSVTMLPLLVWLCMQRLYIEQVLTKYRELMHPRQAAFSSNPHKHSRNYQHGLYTTCTNMLQLVVSLSPSLIQHLERIRPFPEQILSIFPLIFVQCIQIVPAYFY
jgi:hypothetical protein